MVVNDSNKKTKRSIRFKRFYTVLLLISFVLMLLGSIIRVVASYADDVETPGWDYPVYYSWENCCKDNPGYEHSYIYINTDTMQYDAGWGCQEHVCGTYFFCIDSAVEYTEDNGVITIPKQYIQYKWYTCEYHYELDGRLVSDQGPTFLFGSSMSTDLVIKSDLSFASFNGSTFSDTQIVYGSYDFDGIKNKRTSIDVHFNPTLSGTVDRSVVTVSGNTALTKDLIFDIKNNGNTAVQYQMYIVAKNQTTHRDGAFSPGTYFDDDPVFKYYSMEWVYSKLEELKFSQNQNVFDRFVNALLPWAEEHQEIASEYPTKQNKPTDWHYLAPHSSFNQLFHFSQINLKQGVEYTVVVNAIACPYDCATLISSANPKSDLCQLDLSSADTVYSSDFSMLQYDDIVYDPNDDSMGVIPYNGYDGTVQAEIYKGSYDSIENPDGSIDYKGFEYKTPNSNTFEQLVKNDDTGGTSDYNGILSRGTQAYGFLGTILSYFYISDVSSALNLALWLTFFIFVIKRVK